MVESILRRPYLVVVCVLVVVVLGAASLRGIPTDLLPTYRTPAVQVVTFYPGMPPEVMEGDIMSRIERWTGQSVGIARQEGKAMPGVSVVKDYFHEGVSLDTAMSQVTSYAMSDLFYLPPGTIPPMVMPFDPTATTPLCLISVSSPTLGQKQLYDVAYFELRNRLQSIRGVIAPAVYGGKLRRILAYVDRQRLESFNLAPMDVVRALQKQNVFIPAGTIKSEALEYQIFTNAMPDRVAELNRIPITVRNGVPILVQDVARVRDSSQIQTNIVRVNGREQVYIPIYRQPGANTIEIVESIKESLDQILVRLREKDATARDLSLQVVLDQSVYVRSAIRGLVLAGVLGTLLSAAVIFLFLRDWRSTLVVSLAIPLSLLAAVVGLFYSGDTFNLMTLAGLATAVGILVDQSIVVLENVIRHRRMGKPAFVAARDGTTEVALPVLATTLTFIVVFFPIVFLSGVAKFLLAPLARAKIFAIVASYLVSLTVIPVFCARFLSSARHGAGAEEPHAADAPGGRYGRWLEVLIRRRRWVLAGAAALFVAGVSLLARAGTELFPQVDAGQFRMFVRMPSGTRIERTQEMVAGVEGVIREVVGEPDPDYPRLERHPDSDLRVLISNIGVLMDWPAAYTSNTGPMDAFLLVQLKGKRPQGAVFADVGRLRSLLAQRFPDLEVGFDTGGMLSAALNQGEEAPLHVQIAGSQTHTSERIARLVAGEMAAATGVAGVRIAQRLDVPALNVEIDRVRAAIAGVSMDDAVRNLVTATNSSINFSPAFWVDKGNGNHYFIGAQYAEADLQSADALLDVPISGPGGARVPLRSIATITRGAGPAVINHVDITRVIDVYGEVEHGHKVGTVAAAVERRLRRSQALALAPASSGRARAFQVNGDGFEGKGYTLTVAGEVQIMHDAFRQLGFGLAVAVILIYLVLVAQLASFTDALVVLLIVPLGFIGEGFVLFLTGVALNVESLIGMIMMVGIIVEFSIILVDFANRRIAAGAASPAQAIVEAARVRLRPILMTLITAILAILPMAFGFAGGDENVPLAVAILGGLVGAGALALFVVPCLYVTLHRQGSASPAPAPAA